MKIDYEIINLRVRGHLIDVLEERLEVLRKSNDRVLDLDKTNAVRGRIAECKRLLSVVKQETGAKEDDDGPEHF